jgi:hypothetical protein
LEAIEVRAPVRSRPRRLAVGTALLLALAGVLAPVAAGDWSGDRRGDVLAIDPNSSALLLFRGNGVGGFAPNTGEAIGSGWAPFTALLATDFSGDRRVDLLARNTDGTLLMYRGNGAGGFATGTGESLGGGWQAFDMLIAPGDFDGDRRNDILARQPDGALLLYRGTGNSGFIGGGTPIGAGWQVFTALLGPGDWDGDGRADLLARGSDGTLYMYRGNGKGGWLTGASEKISSGWAGFSALLAGGDFNGGGLPDILARLGDGRLVIYKGDGRGGFLPRQPVIGAGWQSLTYLTLVGQPRKPASSPSPPPAPPSAPVKNGRVRLNAGDHCVPPGGRLHVSLKIRKRKGHKRPRVARVVFFVRNGPRRTDRKRPYEARLRLRRPAGQKGRVYARVFFRRTGTKKLRKKTVARRYVMCG